MDQINDAENLRCKVCHILRAPENILVLTYYPIGGNKDVTAVVRYCKDKPACLAGAKAEAKGREVQ